MNSPIDRRQEKSAQVPKPTRISLFTYERDATSFARKWIRLRTNLTLLVVAGFIILNVGLMQLRIPPVGAGVPVAEVVIAIYLSTILMDWRFAGVFGRVAPIVPLLIWWSVGFGHLLFEVPIYGFWAFRDAAHLMETLFLWVGFVAAARPGFLVRFESWLRITLSVALALVFTYPFRNALQAISPKLPGVNGSPQPLFFTYANLNAAIFTTFFRMLIAGRITRETVANFLVTCCAVVIVIVFFQQRTAYLQIVALVGLLSLFRAKSLSRLGMAGIAGMLVIAVLLTLPIKLTGRLGDSFSIDFLLSHIQAIWGGGGDAVRGAAAGVNVRLDWWQSVYERVNASIVTSIFGLGYGLPLTNFFAAKGQITREVHNSFVSVYGRMGLIGLLCFLFFQMQVYIKGLRLVFFLKHRGDARSLVIVGSILCYMLMCFVFAMGEGAFETSYVSVPYYFFAGVLLALDQTLRRAATKSIPPSEDKA